VTRDLIGLEIDQINDDGAREDQPPDQTGKVSIGADSPRPTFDVCRGDLEQAHDSSRDGVFGA